MGQVLWVIANQMAASRRLDPEAHHICAAPQAHPSSTLDSQHQWSRQLLILADVLHVLTGLRIASLPELPYRPR